MIKPGAVFEQMVLNIDLAPTLCDFAGIPRPAHVQGRSWKPVVEGKDRAGRDSWLYEYNWEKGFPWDPTQVGVRTARHKYIRYPDVGNTDPGYPLKGELPYEELYDLQNDPLEMRNLARDNAPLARQDAGPVEETPGGNPLPWRLPVVAGAIKSYKNHVNYFCLPPPGFRVYVMNTLEQAKLAINGGEPVRKEPLPLEFPGVHWMNEEEAEAAARVVRSRSLFRYYGIDPQGEVETFEREFAAFLGVRHAVAVGSGTGALYTALGALGVGPGQEVIVPAYMWVSVAAAVINRGAIPVVADIDDTFGLNAAAVEQLITERTTGIIFVHMSGAPGRVEPIVELARKRKLFVLEDCAQCAGGSIGGRKVGTFGTAGIFSFQMNKNMTSGEGGCLVTDDPELYRRAFACHDLGYPRNAAGRLVTDVSLWGSGCRLDEIRGAVLRVQLRKLPSVIGAMRASKYRIRAALVQLPGIGLRAIADPVGDTGCFLITTYRTPETAARFNAALRAEGIVTSPQGISNVLMTEWGLHLYYNIASLVNRTSVDGRGFPWCLAENRAAARGYDKGACPVADSLFERSIVLPVPSCLTPRDEQDIIMAFQKVAKGIL